MSDGDSLLEIMADYFDDDAPTGNPTYLMNTITTTMNIHNTNKKNNSGALSEVCEIARTLRILNDQEETHIRKFKASECVSRPSFFFTTLAWSVLRTLNPAMSRLALYHSTQEQREATKAPANSARDKRCNSVYP